MYHQVLFLQQGSLCWCSCNFISSYGDAGQLNATSIQIEGSTVTSTAAELNLVDGSEAGTVVNSRAVIYGSSGEINAASLQSQNNVAVLSSAAELNILKGVTSTKDEINLLDGASSSNNVGEKVVVSSSDLDVSGLRNINVSGNLTASGNVVIGSTTLSESDASLLTGVTSGTAAEKVVALDSSKNISGINNITLEGTLSDGTMSLVGGVLSNLASASIESNNALLTVKSTDPSDGASKNPYGK